MENLLDPTNQVETEPLEVAQPAAIPEKVEAEATTQPPTEESETSIAPQSSRRSIQPPKLNLRKHFREKRRRLQARRAAPQPTPSGSL